MKEITYEKLREFVKDNIVHDEQLMDTVIRYLLTEFEGVGGECVKSIVEADVLLGKSDNLFIPNTNIYINLKKLTVLVLACVCDIYITKGAATAVGVALGKITPCIYKLDRDDCCIFAKVLFYSTMSKGVSIDEIVNDYTRACSNKANKRCEYCKNNCICDIKEVDIKLAITRMLNNGVIEKKDNLLYIA